jgi:bleomycin hydrolase
MIFVLVASALAQTTAWQKAFYRPEKNFDGKPDTILSLDFSRIKFPKPVSVYNPVYHTPPIPQDTTNTCWSFAATSLLETELKRLGRGEIALSRMHTVYWEYVEKVRRFVQTKGHSLVAPGSQLNAVLLRMQTYGAVPAEVYSGLLDGASVYDERKMLHEIEQHLDYIRSNQLWYEEQAIANVRMIMDRYMGPAPQSFSWQGRTYTPKQFCDQVLALPLNDYVSFISFLKYPFWTQNSYPVPDNWWKCQDYYNVPLADFYQAIKTAIQKGFSVAIAGDVSEPGKYGRANLAIVPSFDLPSAFINQDSREFRFYNRTSTDDHGMHVIGYKAMGDQDWFLIKDSADSAWRGEHPGYHFFSGDYIRLKILTFMVHKDAVKELLENYKVMSGQNR